MVKRIKNNYERVCWRIIASGQRISRSSRCQKKKVDTPYLLMMVTVMLMVVVMDGYYDCDGDGDGDSDGRTPCLF